MRVRKSSAEDPLIISTFDNIKSLAMEGGGGGGRGYNQNTCSEEIHTYPTVIETLINNKGTLTSGFPLNDRLVTGNCHN